MIRKTIVFVLIAASVVLSATWAITYSFSQPMRWENHDDFLKPGHCSITLGRFGLDLAFTDEVVMRNANARQWHAFGVSVNVLGVYSRPSANGSLVAPRRVSVDLSFPWVIGILLVYPCYVAVRIVLNRLKRKSGFCPVCGYDLTGNMSGTCPECGKPIEFASNVFNTMDKKPDD